MLPKENTGVCPKSGFGALTALLAVAVGEEVSGAFVAAPKVKAGFCSLEALEGGAAVPDDGGPKVNGDFCSLLCGALWF